MPRTREVLTVFIASPSDLADERKKAFEIAAEISVLFKKKGLSIDLLGWEDRLPGYGRPQSQINQDVEVCDLFIGLLWRRWGTPPTLGSAFSSGFEEEFSIAKSRRERTGSPEIWMYFKKVEPAQMADAGAELQRVIAFRSSLIEGKEILFSEFANTPDWEKALRNALIRYLLDMTTLEPSQRSEEH